MKASFKFLFTLVLLAFSCSQDDDEWLEETFWVYSYSIPMIPGSPPSNPKLIISRGAEFNFDRSSWEFIPSEIEGFIFKPTYFQKLLVSQTEDPKTGLIRGKLLRVLAEEKDFFHLLEGSWEIKRQMEKDFPNEDFPNGHFLSFIPLPRVAVSSDGCNQITLEVKEISQDKILSIGSSTLTLIACPLSLPRISPFIGISYNFKREGNTLTFYSDTEGEIAVWEKMN